MKDWIVKIEGQKKSLGKYATREEGFKNALYFIYERFPKIPDLLKEVRTKNASSKLCSEIIEAFFDFPNIGESKIPELIYDFCETEGVKKLKGEQFSVEVDAVYDHYLFYEFNFGNGELRMETNIWDFDDENLKYFVRVNTKTDDIKICINKSLSDVANCFLVYKALGNNHQSRAELRSNILNEYSRYDIDIAADTISNHIHTLQYLGIPIYEKKINLNEREIQEMLGYMVSEEDKPGFYIDSSKPIAPDFSKITQKANIMLVYLTLKEIDRAHALSTQQAVIDAVYDKFGVTFKRQKVKNYLNILSDLGAGIRHDKFGYWIKN